MMSAGDHRPDLDEVLSFLVAQKAVNVDDQRPSREDMDLVAMARALEVFFWVDKRFDLCPRLGRFDLLSAAGEYCVKTGCAQEDVYDCGDGSDFEHGTPSKCCRGLWRRHDGKCLSALLGSAPVQLAAGAGRSGASRHRQAVEHY